MLTPPTLEAAQFVVTHIMTTYWGRNLLESLLELIHENWNYSPVVEMVSSYSFVHNNNEKGSAEVYLVKLLCV